MRALFAVALVVAACGSNPSGAPGVPDAGVLSDVPLAGVDAPPADVDTWLGTLQLGTTDNDVAYGVAVDSKASVYVVGATHGQLAPEGDPSLSQWFVTRLSVSGRRLWTRQLITGAAVHAVVGADDTLYVAGEGGLAHFDGDGAMLWQTFKGRDVHDLTFGPDGDLYVAGLTPNSVFPGGTRLPSIGPLGGTYDGFVSRVDPTTGSPRWSVLIGTAGNDWVNGIAVGAGGEIYVAGGTAGFFPGATTISTDGSGRDFLMRLAPDGTMVWAQEGLTAIATGLRLDAHGALLMISGGNTFALSKHDPATGTASWKLDLTNAPPQDLAIDATGRVWLATSFGYAGVMVVDGTGAIVGLRGQADSPSRGMGGGDLWGQGGSAGLGVGLAPDGSAYLVGLALGDMPGNINVSTSTPAAIPGDDAFVTKFGADLVVQGVTLRATPPVLPLAAGAHATVSATAVDAYGHPVAGAVTWTSTGPAVAAVNAAGAVTGTSDGRADLVPHLDRVHGIPAHVKVGTGGTAILFGSDHSDVPQAATITPAGELLVGGWTNDAFDGQTLQGLTDAFITKVGDDGNLAWVEQSGGANEDAVLQLVSDTAGNVYAVGSQSDPAPGGTPSLSAFSVDAGGHRRWTWSLPPAMNETHTLNSIAISGDGRVYAGGSINDALLIVELDPATGAELWRFAAPQFNDAGFKPTLLAVDANGDLLVGGPRSGATQQYDGQTGKVTRATGVMAWGSPFDRDFAPPRAIAVGTGDDFYLGSAQAAGAIGDGSGLYEGDHGRVSRVSGSDGSFVWQTEILPPGATANQAFVNIAGVAVGPDGGVYAAGSILSSGNPPPAFEGGHLGGADAILVKLGPDGSISWAREFGSASNDYATAIAIGPDGDIAVVGYTFGDFGGASLRGLRNPESCDVFVTWFAPDGTRRAAP